MGNIKKAEVKDENGLFKTTTTYEYDLLMRLIEETDGNGNITEYKYDVFDRITQKRILTPTRAEIYKEGYLYQDGYDANRSLVTKTIYGDTAAQNIVTTTYTDKLGRVVNQGRKLDAVEILDKFDYDYLGNQLQATVKQSSSKDLITKYEYDHAGRVTKVTNPNNTTVLTTYDWLGRQKTVKDPKGSESSFEYDAFGRVTKETIPFDETGNTVKEYEFDNNGNMTKQSITNNKPGETKSISVTEYGYTSRNWPEWVKTFDNYTKYEYDNVGNKTKMLIKSDSTDNSPAKITQYKYNHLNQLIKLTDALGQAEEYRYDLNGNLIYKKDRNGIEISNKYDELNRLLETREGSNPNSGTLLLNNEYYKTGLPKLEQNENYKTEYTTYDSLGRVTTQKETNLNDSTVANKEYYYDYLNNRILFNLIQSGELKTNQSYTYDDMNRLKTTSNFALLSATYTYDANGNRETLEYPNGIKTSYTYNKANLVTSLENKKGNEPPLSRFTYTYYLDGNQASKTDSAGRATTYIYDGLGRLKTEEEKLNGTLEYKKVYTFDFAGNRKKMEVGGKEIYTTEYNYDDNNRLTKETKSDLFTSKVSEYNYDPNGNQISKTTYNLRNTPTGNSEFGLYIVGIYRPMPREDYTVELSEYNILNQLISVKNDEGTTEYAYKADGLRLSKDVNGEKTTHVWDGGYAQTPKMGGMVSAEIVMELDGNGNVIDRYIYGIGRIKSDKHGFYLYNAHGDVVQLTSANGVVTKNYLYDAFGVETNKDDADNNPFRYCAEYYDKETETIYLRNRYYSPLTGRFTQEDPIGAGLNWYTYCNNNPILLTDPLGLIPTTLEAAYMAQHIYDATDKMYNKDLGKEFGGWMLTDIKTNKEGLKIGVYSRTVNGVTEYSLVNKGTSTLGDWGNNFQQPAGWSDDMKDSITKSKQFVADHNGYEITMVGHSKGGAEAVANAVASGKNCIVFNPATTFLSSNGLSADGYTASMTVFVVRGEILHTAEGWFSKPIDKLVYLPTQYQSDWWKVWEHPDNAIKNHMMEAVIKGLKAEGYK